jgi:hypothetical protein
MLSTTQSAFEESSSSNLKGSSIMKAMKKVAIGALIACGVTVATAASVDARVSIGIGIGIPGVGVYGPGYYPPGPCYNYHYAYNGYCGYPAYADPVFIGGVWYNGSHNYRTWHGQQQVWLQGNWHSGYRGGLGGSQHR